MFLFICLTISYVLCLFYKAILKRSRLKETAPVFSVDEAEDIKAIVNSINNAPLNELKNVLTVAINKYRSCANLFKLFYKKRRNNIAELPSNDSFKLSESVIRRYWLISFILGTLIQVITFFYKYYYCNTHKIFTFNNSIGLYVNFIFETIITLFIFHCCYAKKGTVLLWWIVFSGVIYFAFASVLLPFITVFSSISISMLLIGVGALNFSFLYFSFRLRQINKEARARRIMQVLNIG